MEKIAPKDLQNSLPIAIMLPSTGISCAQTEPVSKRSGQGSGDFSEKLSAALDQPETVAKKENTKPVKEARNEEEQASPQSGLPIGLAWNQPEVQIQTPSLPESGGNTSQSNQTGIVETLLQNKGVISAAVQTLMGPVAAVATQVVAQAVQTLMKPETPVAVSPVNSGATPPMQQMAVKNIVTPPPADENQAVEVSTLDSTIDLISTPKAQIPAPAAPITAEASPIVERSTQEQPSLQRVALPNSPVHASAASVQPAVSQNTAIPAAQIVTAAKQQSGASIDPQIQQDIQTVQVSMVPKLSAMPTTSTPAITEVKPSEPHTEAVTGMTEPTLDPVVVSTTEKEMSQEYLGRDESDLLLKADDKIDSTAIASVAFDKVLNSVEPTMIAKEVAPEQRSDPYAVARQVMDGMSLSTDRVKSSQVIITLKPEHLGEVTVKINVDGDKVTAAFHAASSEVRAILESSLPQLRQELSQQGWKFDSDGVYAGMKEFMANQQQQQSQAQEQQLQQFHRRSHRDMYDDTTAFTNAGRMQVMTAAAVDYRI